MIDIEFELNAGICISWKLGVFLEKVYIFSSLVNAFNFK
jgi:hypothetical protein